MFCISTREMYEIIFICDEQNLNEQKNKIEMQY